MIFRDLPKTYLIAEIGVNHGGNVELAKEMVMAAKKAGADAVKFQTFTADSLVTPSTPKVDYQKITTSLDETHYEMIKNLEFKYEDHLPVIEFCNELGIDFISTPYDLKSAIFLDELGVQIFKIASADIVDFQLNKFLASTGKAVIISTGMASLEEVEVVVDIYRKADNLNICLLHCVSNYPCSITSLNMTVIKTLYSKFQLSVGYSDHSVGSLAASISVALGARVIEKHFTLDKEMEGPDHKASSTPSEFLELVQVVRDTEVALGSPDKKCQDEEKQMRSVSRKSIMTAHDLPVGKVIEEADLVMKRPGTGLLASHYFEVIGRTIAINVPANSFLSWEDLEQLP